MSGLDLGRGFITENLVFVGEVAGGGAVGPGDVRRYVNYDKSEHVYYFSDDRSGSKRSGSCKWQLKADALYVLTNVATGSRHSGTFYVSTAGGVAVALTASQFKAERERIFPLGAEAARAAAERSVAVEKARIERETREAADREKARAAMAEINAAKAAEIEKNGQQQHDGLPSLKGTPKQIAYALSIRDAFAKRNPAAIELKKATAKYWIENHRAVLWAR